MKYNWKYTFTVGTIAIISGLLALACMLVGAKMVEYNFDAFSDPLLTLRYAHNYQWAKWFNLLDMFGYYLLLLPLVFYFHQQFMIRSAWMPLFTFSGLAYVLTGAVGAAILAALWPDQMREYLSSSSEHQPIVMATFKTTALLVTKGMWDILEMFFAALWWIGTGRLLYKENKTLCILTIVTGICALINAVGNIAEIGILSDAGLNVYLFLAIVWPVAMGVSLVRKAASHRFLPVKNQPVSTFQTTVYE